MSSSPDQPRRSGQPVPTAQPLQSKKILLVENEAMDYAHLDTLIPGGFTIHERLRRLGARVVIEASARGAQRRLESEPFDVCILDYLLFDTDRGTDIAHWMNTHSNERIRAIIRISNSSADINTILQGEPDTIYHAYVAKRGGKAITNLINTVLLHCGVAAQP